MSPSVRLARRAAAWCTAHRYWLVSLAVHLLVLLVLSCYRLSLPADEPLDVLVVAARSVEPPESTEPIELEELPEWTTVERVSIEVSEPAASGLEAVGPAEPMPLATAGGPSVQLPSGQGQGGAAGGPAGPGSGAEFFGIRASGTTFVYLVDSSRSMSGGRFEAAIDELLRSLDRLEPPQRFYVILFDGSTRPMTLDGQSPAARPAPASLENRLRVRHWLSTIELERGTDPADALRMALDMSPDAIFLLTDGQFGARTERTLGQHNRIDDPAVDETVPVPIHTIGFYSRSGEAMLSRIAHENRGSYRFVPQPPAGR